MISNPFVLGQGKVFLSPGFLEEILEEIPEGGTGGPTLSCTHKAEQILSC